ncbi:MAG: hotdog domain-containing protein [Bryobacteraceae bacterium]
MQGKPVRESVSEYSELALPNDANGLGHVLGGKVMHLVDMAGAMAAMRHARKPVVTENLMTGERLHTCSAYLTFVGLDENGNAAAVAPVVPETEEEKRRFREAGERREYRLSKRGQTHFPAVTPPCTCT